MQSAKRALGKFVHSARVEFADQIKELGVGDQITERPKTCILPWPEETDYSLTHELDLSTSWDEIGGGAGHGGTPDAPRSGRS